MAYPNLTNGWTTTLAGSLTNVATTVDVTSTSGIPSRPFQAVIRAEGANTDEIVTVTGLSGSTITITRATEANAAGSSSASAHAAGATISHVLTKQSLTDATTYATGNKWTTGTSMPGSPSTNDRVTRTDLGMDFYYDGTRWLSTSLYQLVFAYADTINPATIDAIMSRQTVWYTDFDLWLENFYATTFVLATNDAARYWQLKAEKNDAAGGTSVIATVSTQSDTPSNYVVKKAAIGALLGGGSTYKALFCKAYKTSTAGNLYIGGAFLTYRLVGT